MIGVILITNPSCGSCRELERVWGQLVTEYGPEVKFITIDASIRPEVLDTYNAEHIPSIVFVNPDGDPLEVIDPADWVNKSTITEKLADRGYQPAVGAFMVVVNKVRQNWYWWVIGLLVVVLGVLAYKMLKKKR